MHLLVMACSQSKALGNLPAYDLYVGTHWRVLKKRYPTWLDLPPDLILRILSAEYGLIPPDQIIASYDRKMDTLRSTELQATVSQALTHYRTCEDVYLNLSPRYRFAVKVD